MEFKVCSRCKLEKNIEDFRLKKTNGVYKRYYCCLECERKLRIEYESRPETKQKKHDYKQKYMKEHKEEIRQKNKEYNARPEVKQRRKQYLLDNKDHTKKVTKEYQRKHRKELNEKERTKRQTNNIYRLKNIVRKLVGRSFNYINKEKCKKTKEVVGLPIDKLEKHLLQTFRDNYGYEWDGIEKVHIDHKTPLVTAKTEEDVIKLCHYTNLQLLKAEDNLKKGTKLDWKLGEDL